MSLPSCGCRTGCQHHDHPQFPAQRTCRLGRTPTAVPGQAAETTAEITMAQFRAGLAVLTDTVSTLRQLPVRFAPAITELTRLANELDKINARLNDGEGHSGPGTDGQQ